MVVQAAGQDETRVTDTLATSRNAPTAYGDPITAQEISDLGCVPVTCRRHPLIVDSSGARAWRETARHDYEHGRAAIEISAAEQGAESRQRLPDVIARALEASARLPGRRVARHRY